MLSPQFSAAASTESLTLGALALRRCQRISDALNVLSQAKALSSFSDGYKSNVALSFSCLQSFSEHSSLFWLTVFPFLILRTQACVHGDMDEKRKLEEGAHCVKSCPSLLLAKALLYVVTWISLPEDFSVFYVKLSWWLIIPTFFESSHVPMILWSSQRKWPLLSTSSTSRWLSRHSKNYCLMNKWHAADREDTRCIRFQSWNFL